MTVPVTSDLAGYVAFWRAMGWWGVVALVVALAPVYVGLGLIWWAVRR